MRGAFRHAAARAAWTERASLAREGDQPIELTTGTVEPREAARQPAAPEEIAERLLDEGRQALPVAQPGRLGSECLEVVTDDAVEDVVAERSALVDRRRDAHAIPGAGAVPVCAASCPAQNPYRRARPARTAEDTELKECRSAMAGSMVTIEFV
jgi:hypothetical protein